MNKKRLSVVMAGAMLASSVAPVLAADAEVSKVEIEKGALITELTEKIWAAPVFSNDSRVGSVKDAKGNTVSLVGKSVYGIQIDKEVVKTLSKANKGLYTESDLQAEIKLIVEGLKVGQEVKLVNLGYRTVEENGKTLVLSTNPSELYTKAELTEDGAGSVNKELNDLLSDTINVGTHATYELIINETKGHSYNEKDGVYEINLTTEAAKAYGEDKIVLTPDKTERYDFGTYYDKVEKKIKEVNSNNLVNKDAVASHFGGFAPALPQNDDIANKDEAIYTIVSGGDTFRLEDLYDGLYLTTKGEEILNSSKEAYADYMKEFKKNATESNKAKYVVKVSDDYSTSRNKRVDNLEKVGGVLKSGRNTVNLTAKDGKYSVTVEILSKLGNAADAQNHEYKNVFHVTSSNRSQLERFVKWIDAASAEVEVIAGENRYATAVKLAKEVELKTLTANNKTKEFNIVLVNGNSLVDGLAAAPLAQHLAKEAGATKGNAPILLTEAGKLPKATKRYLRELIDEKVNKEITVTLVGGEAVISNNVRKELRELGLNVERFGGANREETSMAVANEIGFENGAFVVGAEGEADAMSISGYAAANEMPVVVSSYRGLSEDAVDALDGAKVNIVGGEAKISKAEEEEISAVADSVKRIAGENRKATNAEVISTFYKKSFAGTRSVIVTRDDELVDALTAANLSVVDNAPIVLGTKSLSDAQKKAIAYNAGSAEKVYQMSTKVTREVTKAIAQALKLS